MRILILSQWFDPEPGFKGMVFARELKRRGHEVEVLTGFPNYPGGRVYAGYRVRLWQREEMEGIRVNRVALYPSHDKSAWRRIGNYVSFAVSAAVLGPFLTKRPDVIYVYHPPLTAGLAGMVVGWLKRAPFVYDIQDLWPDTVGVSGMMKGGLALRVVGWFCGLVYGRAGRIVVLSPGFKRVLGERGVDGEKIEVIYNWCDEGAMKAAEADEGLRAELGLGRGMVVMFAGTMGLAQGLDTVLEAARACEARGMEGEFVMVGGGVARARLVERARAMGLGRVRFVERQPAERMGAILALADVLLVHLRDEPLFRITIPSKTQAYLAVGKPVLMGVRGDAAEVVRRAGAGVVFEPEDVESLVRAVGEFVEMGGEERARMGAAGRRFYEEELSLGVGVERFERVFKSVGRVAELDTDSGAKETV
ncbi:MAG: glycosyltransferase family 4 protein [Bryobacteraceae bacterium]|nr:glycosyltransferase family 4 protein [Bryobacteraceae bacterium]